MTVFFYFSSHNFMKQLLISLFILLMVPCLAQNKRIAYTYLALGDSYTIGEGVPASKRFPVQLIKELKKKGLKVKPAEIVATTGWTTDELTAGINEANLKANYDLVSLLIGVNNQYRGRDTAEYRMQFTELLEKAIEFGSGDPENVIVISIPDYGVTPFAKTRNPEKIAAEIAYFNNINREETQKAGVHYVNITAISKQAENDPSLLAKDELHPSAKMYFQWVNKILPVASKILKE